MSGQLHPTNLVLIICGPAGSGKTTLCDRLLEEFPDEIQRQVTTTSREPRPGEVNGVDYHFLDPDVFEKLIQEGAFIEWAMVHGRFYGSQRKHIESILKEQKDILLNIDVQGAKSFREEQSRNAALAGKVRCIFIRPKSMQQLRERLIARGADDDAEIERRLDTARAELAAIDEFDHVITSGSREDDYKALRAYYLSLKAN
ncbi:MAG: guanylate kinase [Puniceicoccaceae bacterium]